MLAHVLFPPSAIPQTALWLRTKFLDILMADAIWFQENSLAMTPLGYEFKLVLIFLLRLTLH